MPDAAPTSDHPAHGLPSPRSRVSPRSLGCRRIAVAATILLAFHSAPGTAGERPADRSLAEFARASLSAAASRALQGAESVATFALSLVGADYHWGGTSPAQGFDCSGLIRYVFQETTGVALPRTARGLAAIGARVPRDKLAPGDLVFFNTRHAAFSHVGIYLGDNRFIHAPSRGGEVGVAVLSSTYWKRRYDGARRLVGVLPNLVPQLVSTAWAADPEPVTDSGTSSAAPTSGEPATPAEAISDLSSHLSDDQP